MRPIWPVRFSWVWVEGKALTGAMYEQDTPDINFDIACMQYIFHTL